VTSASVGTVARMTGAYRVLLRAYPAAFRERFGSGMTQAFAGRYRAAQALGTAALARFLLRTVSDVLVNAMLVRFHQKDRTPMNWQSIGSDIRYAGRMFARNPIFTTLAVAALALGIGANTAIFTIVNGVLLKPLPYGGERDLVMVWSTSSAEHRDRDTVAPLDFLDYRQAGAFADMQATYSFIVGAALRTAAGTEQIAVTAVTPGMFEMLGRQPALGRTFTAQELQTAVLVSHRFWTSRLGADPNVLGTVLTIQDHPRTIVGVMPADFVFPYKSMLGPSGFLRSDAEAWLPMAFVNNNNRVTGEASLTRSVRFLSVVGRLKPGATVAQANAELSGIARQLAATYPASNRVVGANVVPLHEQAVGAMRPALLLLLGGVGFVLLIACVNLANLLLARSSARGREMAIRSALGAGRRRLIAQTLVETVMLACLGGAVAAAVVGWSMSTLLTLAPGDMPRIGEVRPDATVLLFTFAVSLLTGLAIGIVPALAASKPELQSTLKSSGRGATTGRGQRRLRSGLVVAEVGLAVVLTLGAGLLLRSFLSVLAIDPGFRADNLLTLQIALPNSYQSADQRRALYATLFSRLDALPGVISSGGTTRLPLGSTNVTTKIGVEGRDLPPGEWPEVEFRRAVHDYFKAMGIPVLRGREFNATDGPAAPPVIVINQTMARQLFPNEDPIGRRVQIGTPTPGAANPWSTIVGVIGDVRHSGLEAPPSPEMYMPGLQGPPSNPFIVIRTAADPAPLAATVRAEVQAVDKTIAAYDIRPMSQVRSEAVSQRRFVLLLVAAFGALALLMAAVGVYGVMALIVSERTAEIGIRLALGAQPGAVLRSVVVQGITLAAAGVVAGLAIATAFMPLVRTQLYGIRPLDPPTLLGVPAILIAIAALACFLPARRAMAIDPVDALRN
jgi:putative ABC transport system permease protein